MLTIAVPKGRISQALAPVLKHARLHPDLLDPNANRTLIREGGDYRFLLLKPDDVPTYVEYGAAHIGLVGRDVLEERGYDVLVPFDLQIGRCRLCVAGPQDVLGVKPSKKRPDVDRLRSFARQKSTLRVATKYPNLAGKYFAEQGIPADLIFVQGSVELAPLMGLSDVIVDIVESGATLRDNGLVVYREIANVSTVLIANRAAYRLEHEAIARVISLLIDAPLLAKSNT